MTEEEKKASEAWQHYWERPNVAETFGGLEPDEQNPKYVYEEKPVADLVPNCETLLDAGCGIGRYEKLLKDKAKLIVAVDYSPAMLAEAKRKHNFPNVIHVRGDIENLNAAELLEKAVKESGINVPTDKFDVAICIGIIRHVPVEKGLKMVQNLTKLCRNLYLDVTVTPENEPLPMPIVGYPDSKILDHPYYLPDIKKALGTQELSAIKIGDRQPTKGIRYLLKTQFEADKIKPLDITSVETKPSDEEVKRQVEDIQKCGKEFFTKKGKRFHEDVEVVKVGDEDCYVITYSIPGDNIVSHEELNFLNLEFKQFFDKNHNYKVSPRISLHFHQGMPETLLPEPERYYKQDTSKRKHLKFGQFKRGIYGEKK